MEGRRKFMPHASDTSGWIATRPDEDERESFGMADFFRVIAARQRLIRNVALLTIALAFVVAMSLPTMWTTSASVMLDQRKNTIADQSSVLTALPTDAPSLQNQLQILTSRDLAGQVIDKLGLDRDPEFAGGGSAGIGARILGLIGLAVPHEGAPTASRDEVIDRFLSHLSVDSEGLSTTLSISFAASEPEKAARIANAVAETYIADQLAVKNQITNATTKWLNDRIEQLATQVQAAESAAQKYKADYNLNEAADGTPLTDQQLSAISTQVVQAKADLAQKEAAYDQVKALAQSGNAADVSQVVASPLIVQLRTQQAELVRQEGELATRYGPRHPKRIAAEKQRQDLEAKIQQEVQRISGSIANDVTVARAQVRSLEASLKQAEKNAGTQNLARVKLKALQANAASTRTMYEAFVQRMRETQDAIQTSDARIISRAPVPESPSSPKRSLIVGASIPAGLLLGIILALLADRFGGGAPARRMEYVAAPEPAPAVAPVVAVAASHAPVPAPAHESIRSLPVLGEIPNAVPTRAASYVYEWPRAAFTHAIGALVDKAANTPRTKVIAVCSAQAGEGATTIAASLARMAASKGKRVIVVDADLSAPSVAPTMELTDTQAGLTQVLTGALPLSRALAYDPHSGAAVLPPGPVTHDIQALTGSQAFGDLIGHLRKAMDLVIVDCPPVLTARNFRLIARHCDATWLVVRDGEDRPAVTHAINGLASMGAPNPGIVIAR